MTILAENYARADENTARFIGRSITWGEFVTANQALVTERRAQLLAAGERMQRTLVDGQPTDAADRQQAEAALSTWTRQQQILLPNQPMTTCRSLPLTKMPNTARSRMPARSMASSHAPMALLTLRKRQRRGLPPAASRPLA